MFTVSAKTQYGIRALVHLARLEESGRSELSARADAAGGLGEGPGGGAGPAFLQGGSSLSAYESIATAASIARTENISPKYLEGILSQLTSAGLLVSGRGKRGGYRLARPAADIRMLEVVEALEGRIRPVGCVDEAGACAQGTDCLPRLFWCGLKDAVDGYLESRSLRDVIDA